VRHELGQSAEHFRQAATHAAHGTGAIVGPKINSARDRVQPTAGRVKDAASSGWGSTLAALAPLAVAATEGARQAGTKAGKASNKVGKAGSKDAKKLQKRTNKALGRKQKGRKGTSLAGLLIAGAAVGAGAAFILRRRKRQQWDEYDPSRPIGAADQAGSETSLAGALKPSDAAIEPTTSPAYGGESLGESYGDPGIAEERTDQTSSAQHSPTVARMTGGSGKS
jgi:hypothetical protein